MQSSITLLAHAILEPFGGWLRRTIRPDQIMVPDFHNPFSGPEKSPYDPGQTSLSFQIPGTLGIAPLFIREVLRGSAFLATEC